MDVTLTISVPQGVYDMYTDIAKRMGDFTTEEAMSAALEAYIQHLMEEMMLSGELSENKPNLTIYNGK